MIVAVPCNPKVQRRVQEELDMVIGKDRSKSQRFDRPLDSHECLITLH